MASAPAPALLAICIQDLEDIFLKFPSAEACFRDELREAVCKLPITEALDPNKSGLEAGEVRASRTGLRFQTQYLNSPL